MFTLKANTQIYILILLQNYTISYFGFYTRVSYPGRKQEQLLGIQELFCMLF